MARNHPHAIERPHHFQVHVGALAAAADFSVTVPVLAEWKLVAMHIRITTDANAADRLFRLEYTTVGQPDFDAIINPSLIANTQYDLWWGMGFGHFNNLFNAGLMTGAIPDGPIIPGLGEIRTRLDNGQAGDRINAVDYQVYQWLDPVHG